MNAAALHPAHGLPPGTRLGEFEVQAVLGVGGFGIVYRAYDHSLHRTVAIKEYLPGGLAGRAGPSLALRTGADAHLFDAGLRSFLDEARLLAQFDHPSLVKVFRVWEQNRTAYMVMPLYQGMTLKDACVQMRTPPPERWLRKLLWSVLQALELLHRQGTLHRDISPDNIFLQDIGPPVLLDLGAARRVLGGHNRQHTAILKVNYAPIEQYADAGDMPQGPWSDIYALAAVVYGCLSQVPPLPATMRVLRDGMPSPVAVTEGLRETHGLAYSPALVDALAQALAVEPDRRPRDLAAFRARLQLEPVPDMDRFDWRAELGEVWQPSRRPFGQAREHAPTQAMAPPQQRADAPRQAAQAESRPAGGPRPPAVAAARPPVSGAAHAWWPKAGVAGVAALIVGLLVAMGMVAAPRQPQAPAGAQVRAAPAAPPPVAAAPVAPAAVPPLPGPAAPAATAPTATAQAAPSPVPAPVSAPALSPPPTPPPTSPAASAPPPMPAPAVEPARPVRPRALSAEQICPDSNFFTRPMCLFHACQKPAYADMPVCVENTRRLRENERRLDP